ncbi:MAG: tetratricopeptide repeat protein [Saprospiraceae bacterium]|nr:tetratricopeptide repeat protein [Saprospiraceae bacterium]
MMRRWLVIFLALNAYFMNAQTKGKAHDLRRDADQAYDQKNFENAEEAYRRSTILDPDEKGVFNLGNAIFNQNRYEEAAKQYEKAIDLIDDPQEKSKAWYNLGNAHYLNGKYEQSVDAYKNALISDPGDLEAKQNLLMALREMKMQEQQQQQQQQQEDQEQQENQQQQQQQQQQQEDQQQQNQQNQNSEQEQAQQEEQDQQLTKDQAMQLLEIIDEEDQKVQEKLRKKEAGAKKKSKDW